MKHLLFAILAFAPLSSGESYVYICTGPQSECYHKNTKCRAFKNCTGNVKEITLSEAINKYKRRPCGYCYKKNGGR